MQGVSTCGIVGGACNAIAGMGLRINVSVGRVKAIGNAGRETCNGINYERIHVEPERGVKKCIKWRKGLQV
jgi:hypothetical protein